MYELRGRVLYDGLQGKIADVTSAEGEKFIEETLGLEILADAEPIVEVSGEGLGFLSIQITCSSEGIEVPIETLEELNAGHLVHKAFLIPFDRTLFNRLRDALQSSRVPVLGEISYADVRVLTKLKASSSLEVRLDTSGEGKLANHFSGNRENLLKSELWDFQKAGFGWMSNLWEQSLGGIIADEMGVGKTIQLLALIAHVESHKPEAKPTLIVVPNNLLLTWAREAVKHAPGLASIIHIHSGSDRSKDLRFLETQEIILTTYSLISQDIDFLRLIDFELLVCDEAHWAKDPLSMRTESIKSLRVNTVFLATGTPVQNRLLDLWNLIDIIDPGLLGTYELFLATCRNSPAEARALGQLVDHRILRRTQADAGIVLPESFEHLIALRLTEEEQETYQSIRSGTHPDFLGSRGRGLISPQRQFAAHPQSLEVQPNPFAGDKLEFLTERFAEIDARDEKAIAFVADCNVARQLYAQAISETFITSYCQVIDGTTPAESRFGIMERFRDFNGSGILFLNPVVSGEGETIVEANHVFHLNPGWNPAKLDQSSFRVKRPGQTKTVFVYQLFYVATIEEAIMDLIDNKREISEAALEAAEDNLTKSDD